MAIQLDPQVDDDPFADDSRPKLLIEAYYGLHKSQPDQEENHALESSKITRERTIDDLAGEQRVGQRHRTGDERCHCKSDQLPPVRLSQAQETPYSRGAGFGGSGLDS